MSDCLFCRIVAGEIPANILHEDEQMMAFSDIKPQAPVHILFIPKRHIASLSRLQETDTQLVGRMLLAISEFADTIPELSEGYRVVVNNGDDGGQTVHHLHFHLLGGRRMHWPPG